MDQKGSWCKICTNRECYLKTFDHLWKIYLINGIVWWCFKGLSAQDVFVWPNSVNRSGSLKVQTSSYILFWWPNIWVRTSSAKKLKAQILRMLLLFTNTVLGDFTSYISKLCIKLDPLANRFKKPMTFCQFGLKWRFWRFFKLNSSAW